MTERRFAWLALAVLGALAAFGAVWGALGPDRIVLTSAQLQQRVNRALPREFKGVTIARATVSVAEGRVALEVETHAAALGQSVTAVVSARGVPRYDSRAGAIFFDADDVKVADFTLAGGRLAERIDRLGGGLRERAEAGAGRAIAAGLEAYLAARPVYRFKDDLKGLVVKTAVSEVATEGDVVAIRISVVRLTVSAGIGLAALLAIVFLVVELVRHPDWGHTTGPAARNDPARPPSAEPPDRDPGLAVLSFLADCADLFTERIKGKVYWVLGAGLKKVAGQPLSQTGTSEVWLGCLLFAALLLAFCIYVARY
jgi:hypothetical protein